MAVLDPKSIKTLKPKFSPVHSLFDMDLTFKNKHVCNTYVHSVEMQLGEGLFTQVFDTIARQNKLSVSKKKPLQINNLPEFLLIHLTNQEFDPIMYEQIPRDIDDICQGLDNVVNSTGLSKPYIL